jgi:Domain of unknown function (DUF4381)
MTAPLDSLHDFYQPPPPSWRPQTIGWYVVFVIAAVLLLWLFIYLIRRWQKNRYRREAMIQLARIEAMQFSALLKRTALSAWPREQVASLSGPIWLRFLDSSVHEPVFASSPADRLEEIAFSAKKLSIEDESALRAAAAAWIRQHKSPRRSKVRQSRGTAKQETT